jgi:hypothetical protein
MAINKNHEFEELNGIKCGIVERNVSAARAAFLRSLLEFNRYTVVIVPSPPPKSAAPVKTPGTQTEAPVEAAPPPPPETFTVGVTDYTFNPVNAIFGRLLHAPGGHVVTQAYWQQKESTSHDEIPYFERG